MKFLVNLCFTIFGVILLILLFGLGSKCWHNNKVTTFSFQPESSTAMSVMTVECKNCDKRDKLIGFHGTPVDKSYIEAVKEHTDDKEFVSGEYDTIRARVIHPDYDPLETKIRCCIQQGEVIVNFSVEFKSEYEESVSSLRTGDEITFYGKSSTTGLSWTDCELITD